VVASGWGLVELELPGLGAQGIVLREKGIVIPRQRGTYRWLERIGGDVARRTAR
jgi:hypothetical protein